MGRIGTTELVLILVVLLLLFGAKRIPDIARSIGKSMSQFKRGMRDVDLNVDDNILSVESNDSLVWLGGENGLLETNILHRYRLIIRI